MSQDDAARIGLADGKEYEVGEVSAAHAARVLADAEAYAGFTVMDGDQEKRVYISPAHVAYIEEVLPTTAEGPMVSVR